MLGLNGKLFKCHGRSKENDFVEALEEVVEFVTSSADELALV